MRRFATLLTLLACLTIVIGCGGGEETSDNPVDNDVPTDDITPGERTDGPPEHLLGGNDEDSDEDADDTDEGSDNDDSDSTDTANESNNEGLVQPDLNAPPNTGPTLEPPKLRDPTKSGDGN